MPSLRSRLFIFALKYRNLLRFERVRSPAIDWNTSIPDLRLTTEKASGLFGKIPKQIELLPVTIGNFRAEWVLPSGARRDRVILYAHGGGYVLGSCRGHRTHVAKFVKGSGIGALVFDYRLAPEHPFPAALEDGLHAYRWLLAEGISPAKIAFVGDSAGGGLCLAMLLAARDNGFPLPAAAAVLSPWTDLKCTGTSLETNRRVDTLTWLESWTIFSSYYAGDHDPGDPLISPLYGDLHGLPPILINVGADELLLDDSTRFAKKATEVGVDVTIRVGKGMFHCYPVCAPLFPEAKEAMQEICTFIREHVGGQSGSDGTRS